MNTDLTKRQREILDYIRQRIGKGVPPSYREIGDEFGISSPNGVRCHLRALERKGLIAHEHNLSRHPANRGRPAAGDSAD